MKLPDPSITDKNDTFKIRGESCASFRLMARAVKRDLYGKPVRAACCGCRGLPVVVGAGAARLARGARGGGARPTL